MYLIEVGNYCCHTERSECISYMYKSYYVYIVSNTIGTVYYTGVTNNLERRILEHKSGSYAGFTKKYNCNKLLYFEVFSDIDQAIEREKKVKKLSRVNKDKLIDKMNLDRRDLFNEIRSGFALGMTGETAKPSV